MRIAIVQFPGSNCERETMLAVMRAGMQPEEFLWNGSHEKLKEYVGYIIVGGFSYEDRARAGVIAALDPIMQVIKSQSELGKPVLGICNGAQVLVETGLVPGIENHALGMVLTDNKRMQNSKVLGTGFYNAWIHMRLSDHYQLNAFTRHLKPNDILSIPVAHAEGRFVIPPALLAEMQLLGANVFQYCDASGKITDEFLVNPNGSVDNIAAVSNKAGNVMAMMPHPERTPNGDPIFRSMRDYIAGGVAPRVAPLNYFPRAAEMKEYQPLSTHYQLIIELSITDNQAITVENALNHLNLPVKMTRRVHWEIQCDSPEVIEQIKTCGVLFNDRKEKVISSQVIRQKKNMTFLIRPKEDMIGLQTQQLLEDHFAIKGIRAIRHGILWELACEKSLINPIINSHILFNLFKEKLLTITQVEPTFSDYFINTVKDRYNNQNNNTNFENVAIELAKLKLKTARKILDSDFEKAKWLDDQFAFDDLQKPSPDKPGQMLLGKIHYWLNICDFYQKQFLKTANYKYFQLMQTVFLGFQENISKIPLKLQKEYYDKYIACIQQLDAPPTQKAPAVSSIPTLFVGGAVKNKLDKLLNNVNANLFLIEKTLEKATSKKLSEKDQHFILLLVSFKSKLNLLEQSPNEFIDMLKEMDESNQSSEVLPILEKYKKSFNKVELYKRFSSDIKMLSSVFTKLPFDILQFTLPNSVTPEESAKFTLKENLKALEKFQLKLISEPLSDSELLVLPKRYRSMLMTLAFGMFTALEKNFLTLENLSYLEANENMRDLIEGYRFHRVELVNTLHAALKNLDTADSSVENWQNTFQKFCNSYSHYVTRLDNFSKTITTFQKPNEGDVRLVDESIKKLSRTVESHKDDIRLLQESIKTLTRLIKSNGSDIRILLEESIQELTYALESAKGEIRHLEESKQALSKSLESKDFKQMKQTKALDLAADIELLQMISTTDKKGAEIDPTPIQIDTNRKSLISAFPYSYFHLYQLLDEIAPLMDKGKFGEAATLMKKLPPIIVKNMSHYCRLENSNVWKVAMVDADYSRAVRIAYATNSPKMHPPTAYRGEEQKYENTSHRALENLANPNHLKKYILDLQAAKLLNSTEQKYLVKIIQRIYYQETSYDEQLLMLGAAQSNFPAGKLSSALGAYIHKIEEGCLRIMPDEREPTYFNRAAALLGYAYNYESTLFKSPFSHKGNELTAAHLIARLLIQVSLLIPEHSDSAKTVLLEQKLMELAKETMNTVNNKDMDPKFIQLVMPILKDTQEKLYSIVPINIPRAH